MKNRRLQTLVLVLMISGSTPCCGQSLPGLRISSNARCLETTEGETFIWLGDTAWELFHQLSREEADLYLQNRAAKGFTVIQAVVLGELDGLRVPNFYGHLPIQDLDPTRINEEYFEHVDWIVNRAEALGLRVGMLPTWGDKVESRNPGTGPVVFNIDNARVYGELLGQRYRDKPIIWILGGDRNVDSETAMEIWRSMARGIKRGCGGSQLLTYHPRGGSCSSTWFHHEDWLDFNMYQSGHSKMNAVYRFAHSAYELRPTKPFVDGEPAYEDIGARFWEYMDFSKQGSDRVPPGVLDGDGLIQNRSFFAKGYITAYDVRVHAYWNFLSGAAGYTYGNNAIWQMFRRGAQPAIPTMMTWKQALDRPGAAQIMHLSKILNSRPLQKLRPDQALIVGENKTDADYRVAASADDGSYGYVYLARGQSCEINLGGFRSENVKATWFNPRRGTYQPIGSFSRRATPSFTPLTSGEDNDWLLVLESQ